MIKVLVILFVIFFAFASVGMVFDALTPPTISEAMIQAAPWSDPKISAWTLGEDTDDNSGAPVDPDDPLGPMAMTPLVYDGYEGEESFACTPPVQGTTYITDCYGAYRTESYNHSGIDYGTNYVEGEGLVAVMGGKVVYTAPYGGWGWTVAIENNGVQTLYTHASEFYVSVGDIVTAGDIIAASGGDTGDSSRDGSSTGNHLHFEVRVCNEDGTRCNAVHPNSILLPGQDTDCDWYQQVAAPERNMSCP